MCLGGAVLGVDSGEDVVLFLGWVERSQGSV